jgi:hypothetical protein
MKPIEGIWPKEVRLTVCLPESLERELRMAAVEQDKPLSAIIRGVLTKWALARAEGVGA